MIEVSGRSHDSREGARARREQNRNGNRARRVGIGGRRERRGACLSACLLASRGASKHRFLPALLSGLYPIPEEAGNGVVVKTMKASYTGGGVDKRATV